MSEYTKEQEAKALEHVEALIRPGRHYHLRVVIAMAKRAEAAEATTKKVNDAFDEQIKERDALRTQLATVTRERDSWRAQRDEVHAEMERQTQLKREERQAKLDAQRERDAKEREIQRLLNVVCDSPACTAAVVRRDDGSRVCAAGHPARWVNVDLLRTAERERDEARESEARMRAALEDVRDDLAVVRRSAHADVADSYAAHALGIAEATLSAPAPEGPDYSGLCSAPECGGHCGFAHARGCEAIREYLAEHGGAPYRAPPRKPSERMMRVAEAVREASALESPPRIAGKTTGFDQPGREHTVGDALGLRRDR